MIKKIILGLSVATLSVLSADAQFSNHALGIKAGSLGAGLEYTTNINDNFDVRIGANNFSYDTDGTESNINYETDLDLQSASMIIDYHPFDNGFILSGGAILNGNEIAYNAKTTAGSYDINGVTYSANDIGFLDGKVDFNTVAPYIGIGYSTVTQSKGFHFTAELGAMYQGSANVSLNAQCGAILNTTQCTTLQNNVAAEKIEFENAINGYDWYPVISIGASYRF